MPLPFILGAIAVATAVTGVAKAVDANDTNKRARRINNHAKEIYEQAEQELKVLRIVLQQVLPVWDKKR